MGGFVTALQAEVFISLRSLGSKIVVLTPALVVLLQFFVAWLRQAGVQTRDDLLGGQQVVAALAAGNAYGHLVDGLDTGLILLGLMLVALAAHTFAFDRDTGLLRHVLIRRVSRCALVLAKLAHLHLLALASLVLLLVVSIAAAGLLWEYGPVVEDGYELIGSAEMQQEIRRGLVLALLPLPALMAFGLLVSVSAQTAIQAVTAALGVTLALDMFKPLLGNAMQYLYVAFQPSLVNQSYLHEVARIVRGYSDVLVDERFLQLNLWVPLPQFLLLSAIALAVVQKRKL
ncbi:MAG: ABC transporter permease subunit [Pseudomonadales bacterium]|nr:ABC transporter permease subunit [Pseudomonadales bacterium]